MTTNTVNTGLKPAVKEVRPFAVTATITRQVSFVVDARTSEEAESICEEWIEDGESGTTNSSETVIEDSYPVEDDSLDAPLNRSSFPRTPEFD